MERAYNMLMDVEQRKAHDSALLKRANGMGHVTRADADAPSERAAAERTAVCVHRQGAGQHHTRCARWAAPRRTRT